MEVFVFNTSKGEVVEPFSDLIFSIFKIVFKGLGKVKTQDGEMPDWIVWLILVLICIAIVIYIARTSAKKSS